ncbi:hypothetical protein [Massilia sp. TSP1-1-2]|uniref:hypothetical protein n=1 Tax=unclassified Massilia TaxID=2609279 RepID=UPI003CF73641
MNYILKIVVPTVPPYNHDAYGFADNLLRESAGLAPSPRLIQFHDALTARFPCPSTGIYDNAEGSPVCPWGHVPLMEGFTGDAGAIQIVARNVEVIPFLLRRAGALALTVLDEQADKVHRPATFSITLDSIQKNVDREAIVAKLVPLFKRSPEEVREVLAMPKAVLKRRLDHVTAQRFSRTLDLIGCNCTVEKEMPELGVTIPISGPGVVAIQPSAQNEQFDSRSPHEKSAGVSWQPSWVSRVWDKVARRRHY